MIRLAEASDLDELMALTRACARDMISKGIFQWNDLYPRRSAFEKDLARRELYVLEMDQKILACIVISTLKDEEYFPVKWLSKTERNMYVHRLAVHPAFQGRGYAQKLMSFAEELARKGNFESVRLDTFSQNKRNQRFYEQRGYQRLGDIYFPKQSEHPFHCYELLL
jgi:ribosomal protein S18 acetylase RimI-like enzyme